MGQVLGALLHSLGGEAAKSGDPQLPQTLLESLKSETTGSAKKFIDFTQQQLNDAGKALKKDLNDLFQPKK